MHTSTIIRRSSSGLLLAGFAAVLLALVGCPNPGGATNGTSGNSVVNDGGSGTSSDNDPDGNDGSDGTSNDSGATSGDDTGDGGANDNGGDVGGNDNGGGDGGANDNGGDVGGNDNGGGADGNDNGDDVPDGDGFVAASIIHRGAGGFPADPKWGVPDASYFNESDGGIKTSVRIPRISSDGSRIWFATQDPNGFVEPQLFVMNADGSGLQEIALPLGDIHRVPAELWPSGDGQLCALLINTGQGTDFSQSTIRIADRRTGQITMLFDARTLDDGNDDFADVQLTADGATVFCRNVNTDIIYTIAAGGGPLVIHTTLPEFTKAGFTPRAINRFRINDDGSGLLANVGFEGGDNSFPEDIYLKTPDGITPITTTGDAPDAYPYEQFGVSDDTRYVLYRRYHSSESRYRAYLYDRVGGRTTTLATGAGSAQTLLDPAGTLVYTWFATDRVYGSTDQLPGLAAVDGSSVLEFTEEWAADTDRPASITSMSDRGGAFVGTWANGAFGDPVRLYALFPNAVSYRGGPSITDVRYKFDATADTLTVRVTVSGNPVTVRFLSLYKNFESFYQLYDDDPFYDVRFGGDLAATGTAGVYEIAVNLRGKTLDGDYRVRITAADGTDAQNFAYVDFRPVPRSGETVDVNGDGASD